MSSSSGKFSAFIGIVKDASGDSVYNSTGNPVDASLSFPNDDPQQSCHVASLGGAVSVIFSENCGKEKNVICEF